MRKFNPVIALVVIVLLSGVYLFLLTSYEPDFSGYERQIENLRILNDSLILSNELLDNQVLKLKSESDSLLVLVQQDKQIIETLKRKKIEKVTAINSFDNNELFEFFSNLQTGEFETKADSSSITK